MQAKLASGSQSSTRKLASLPGARLPIARAGKIARGVSCVNSRSSSASVNAPKAAARRGAMTEPCPMLGFFVVIELASDSLPRAHADFAGALREFLATRGLYAMSADPAGGRWAVASEASQAVDADRDAVRTWLAARSEVVRADVGSIEDLNQPP